MTREGPTRCFRTLAALAFALSVACTPQLENTGFEGRWQRESGGRASEVSIWSDESGWHFCWSARPVGDGPAFTCAADGRTIMTERGEPTYEYSVGMTLGSDPSEATVEIVGKPVLDGLTPIRWKDRLELQPGGLSIESFRIELNGAPLDPPHGPLRLVKIANEPR